jgi:hypothetical protein
MSAMAVFLGWAPPPSQRKFEMHPKKGAVINKSVIFAAVDGMPTTVYFTSNTKLTT